MSLPVVRSLLILIVILWGVRDFLWIADNPPPLPLIHADYQRCFKFENGPILNSHDGHYDRAQPGEKHLDGGIS